MLIYFSSFKTCFAPVAQLDRVLDYESRGQGFESLLARHVYDRSTSTYLYHKRPLPVLEQRAQISFDVVADFLFTCAGICRYESLMVGSIYTATY